jgi:hypothetical protein
MHTSQPVHWSRRRRLRKDGQPYQENLWHTFLMETYSAAAVVWWDEAEEQTALYEGDLKEHKERWPMPQLKDFMIRLGREWRHGKPDGWTSVAQGSA